MPVFLCNESFVVTDANSSAVALFGFADKAASFAKILPPAQPDGRGSEEALHELLNKALKDGTAASEFMLQKIDGTPVPAEMTSVRILCNGSNAVTVYIQDLTLIKQAKENQQELETLRIERERTRLMLEMKENEQQLLLEMQEAERQLLLEMKEAERQMMAKLEEAVQSEQLANKEKTRFLARMSHEIRTPMHSVLGITEVQLQKDTHPKETEDAFLRIYSSSNMLLSIINDILDFTKIEAGKMELVSVAYDTASMIANTVQLNHIYIGEKKIELKLSISKNFPARLVGDELRVKQILNNILSNALKYTPEGSVHLSFGAEAADESGTVSIVIKVADTGQGMTQEQIDNLSGEFSRYNLETNRTIEGTGLGLNIAYHLINAMNGTVSVESSLGKGSTFIVRLPQKPDGAAVIGPDKANSLESLKDIHKPFKQLSKFEPEPMPYGRVLVVDDVETNLHVAEGFLLPYDLTVDIVDSGIAAVEKVKAGEVYDIIFMDHMMPEMDGVEATKIIRSMGYELPIIALTANAFSDTAELYASSGFTEYASKPFDILQMNTFLIRYIRDVKGNG
jgi:signal transduction histidine kinase/CheY-like chemotaxis protein